MSYVAVESNDTFCIVSVNMNLSVWQQMEVGTVMERTRKACGLDYKCSNTSCGTHYTHHCL